MFAFRAKKAVNNTAIHDDEILSEKLGRRFSIADIISATNNFRLVIGQGGWGKVYKGRIDGGSTTVAIKRFRSSRSEQGEAEFFAEVKTLSKLKHINLINLIGYCKHHDEMFLVYEYMHNGTLADQLYKIRGRNIYHFYDTFPLTWERRLNICLGVARGLAYLHAGTGRCFVHRDIKPSNILLDEDWRPKISDFGLSIDVSDGKSISHIAGTPGYLAPENVFACRVIDKADVYAFAVVMLEILSGRPVLGKDSISLVDSALQCINEGKLDSIIDPSLRGQVSDDCLKCFVQVAIKSLNHNPKERPTMSQVVWNLELALMCQQQGTIAKVLQGISVIPPRIDNRWWHMLWQGKGECHESGPSRDVDIQQLFSSTDQRQCRSCRSASTMYLKPLLNTTSLVVDRSFGSRSRDVHLKSPLAESTTQVEVGSSRSTSNGHLEPVSNSSTDIMSKNFGSRSSSNVHLKPPFVENSTLRQRTSSRSASDVHMKPLSGNTAQIVVKNLGTGPSRDVCMQQTFRESTIQKEVRSSKSASNVQLEPVSNNTMGIVDKDFGSRSLGDVHLKPPSAESTTQREGRSSKTVSDVHMKSLLESPTQIGDENIGIKFSRDMHMEPPFVESTINQSANKNLEGRSSRNGHCEPISNSTTEQHTFHFLTGERGAIRYYFDDGVVIGQDCSSKVYRTCIDRPNSKGNTEDGKKSRRHKKNPFTWSVAANWTTIRPWKAKKHISNLYMTTTSKSSSNVREIISQGGHCRVSMDQDSTEKVPRLKDMIDDDVEAINCSVPSQHHDETTISNKPCEDKIKSEKIANGLEISPNNGTAVHEKQTDIGSEEHGNEVELAMTDIVVATKEESKISYDRILHDKTMSHMFEIKATQGKKSWPAKEPQEIIKDNEKKRGDSTLMSASSISSVLDQGDDKGITVLKNMDGAITLKDQSGVEVKLDFDALNRVKMNIRPLLLRIIELRPHTFIQIGKVSSSFVKLIMEHFGGLLELLDHTVLREASADAFDVSD